MGQLTNNLFHPDRLESFLLNQRNRKNKIPAKRLASKLHFLSRYNQDIDLQSLILRPKFFAAALLLGATFNSTQRTSNYYCHIQFVNIYQSRLLNSCSRVTCQLIQRRKI